MQSTGPQYVAGLTSPEEVEKRRRSKMKQEGTKMLPLDLESL